MMDNRDLYKSSFDKLRPEEKLQKELESMMNESNTRRPRRLKALAAIAAAAALVVSLAVAASATGLLDNVRMWINGQEVDASVYTNDDGSIEVSVDVTGDGSVMVQEGSNEASPDTLDGEYLRENGRDLIRFTDLETGEVSELDITDKLVNGAYNAELEVFGHRVQVELTTTEESTSFCFEVK